MEGYELQGRLIMQKTIIMTLAILAITALGTKAYAPEIPMQQIGPSAIVEALQKLPRHLFDTPAVGGFEGNIREYEIFPDAATEVGGWLTAYVVAPMPNVPSFKKFNLFFRSIFDGTPPTIDRWRVGRQSGCILMKDHVLCSLLAPKYVFETGKHDGNEQIQVMIAKQYGESAGEQFEYCPSFPKVCESVMDVILARPHSPALLIGDVDLRNGLDYPNVTATATCRITIEGASTCAP